MSKTKVFILWLVTHQIPYSHSIEPIKIQSSESLIKTEEIIVFDSIKILLESLGK